MKHPLFGPFPWTKHIKLKDYHHPAREPAIYIKGQRPNDGCETPEDMSSGAIASFKLRHPEISTRSAIVLRCLAWLEQFDGR